MINNWRYISLLLLSLLGTNVVHAQFINLQITVEPELSTTIEQELDFGILRPNFGEKMISLGDLNMGVFNIRAYYTQSIFVQLIVPDFMTHTNPAVTTRIPIQLDISYNNSGINNHRNSEVIPGNKGYVQVYRNNENNEVPTEVWKQLFLYIHGSIEVGEIDLGEYIADLTMIINYD